MNLAQNYSPLPDWDWDGLHRRGLVEARRMLRSDQEAEEVVQDAMLRAWRARDRCASPETPAPWVLAIVRNEALRRLSRRPVVFLEDVRAPEAAVNELSDDVDLRLDVRHALGGLSDVDRALVEARYGGDKTYGMLATAFDMPEGTVKVRLHRARKRLRAVLKES
jgi:RNA polymerase sigma-70 factor, ECF subfamily